MRSLDSRTSGMQGAATEGATVPVAGVQARRRTSVTPRRGWSANPEETERPVNVFVYGETSQDVVVFSHRTGKWRVDPGLAAAATALDPATVRLDVTGPDNVGFRPEIGDADALQRLTAKRYRRRVDVHARSSEQVAGSGARGVRSSCCSPPR